MQQITIVGNVGKDAVVKSTNGNDLTTFSVCVNESYTNQQGEKVERSTWYGCVYRRKGVANFIQKGNQILVQGELNPKIYVNDKKEASLDLTVNVARIEFLTSKPKDDANRD
ncbi:MAG: single-stranded DNA-binding protein [Spirosomataceae bacterium]